MPKHIPFFSIDNKVYLYKADYLEVDLPESSIDLVVTSPPYNVGIEYDTYEDTKEYIDYLNFAEAWLKKTYDLLKDDGRICINIPLDNKKKNENEPIYADYINIAKKIGYKYHTSIIWNKNHVSKRTAWGSWMCASSPSVTAPVEMIVVLYKKRWKKDKNGESDISKQEFIDWTCGLWSFSYHASKKHIHPAAFPIDLPLRCIKLFSFVGDVILDPFAGSGTTLVAAIKLKRVAIGVEISDSYCEYVKNECILSSSTFDL